MLQTGSLPIASREAAVAAAISETFRKGVFGSTGFYGASVFFTMDFVQMLPKPPSCRSVAVRLYHPCPVSFSSIYHCSHSLCLAFVS